MGGGHQWSLVTADLDTLLTALYMLIDDHVIEPGQRRRPRKLSDAELVCLAVAQVLLGARSEHYWLRMCRRRLGHLFPYLPHQPGRHKRLKAAAPLICKTAFYLATLCPSWADGLRLLDATPGALRHLPPDRAPIRTGRVGWLRLAPGIPAGTGA
jgi:hypothetical protein